MPPVATLADALRIKSGGVEVQHLKVQGAIPGIYIESAGALNGPGVGRLQTDKTGKAISWRAPGIASSALMKQPISVLAGGGFVAEDAVNRDKFVRVQTDASELVGSPLDVEVTLNDVYNNGIASIDMTIGVDTQLSHTVELVNNSLQDMSNVTVWIDPSVSGVEISVGIIWLSPTDEASGMNFSTITAGNSKTLHIRRTIAGASDPASLVWLHISYTLNNTKHYHDARGLYRVFDTAEYRFYRSSSGPPLETDTPFDTNATLPYMPLTTFADGTWYLSMSYFNGCLDSGFAPIGSKGKRYIRVDVSGGKLAATPPSGPDLWSIEQQFGGIVRIKAAYQELGLDRATDWAIAFTTDASNPAADAPDIIVAMDVGDVITAILDKKLPAQANATEVRVRLQTRRLLLDGTYVYSENSIIKTIIIDTVGPTAPLRADHWTGRTNTREGW